MIFCRKGLRVSRRRSYKFPAGFLARQALPGDPTELNRIVVWTCTVLEQLGK